MITIKNLTKVYETINYNVIALSNLNFKFEKGEVVVLLGRSGSGKSTFLNILGGFDNTYSGSYFFDNNEFKAMAQSDIDALRSKKIGFIFQHQVLFSQLTVVENVELSLDVLGVTNSKKKRLNAMKALTLVGLRRHAYKKPWQLSGGEKQRLAIARAIVKDPEVIICDEPTAALDSVTSKEVLDLLASVCKNKLLIIATHNKSIVKNYGTRIIELKSGYVVRDELVKPDKSNVEVDEYDKLLDEDLYGDYYEVIEGKSEYDLLTEKVEKSEILKDLNLDLSQYKERSEEVFNIDEKEKKLVIEKRKEEVLTEERFDTFDTLLDTMANDKNFARKSFFHYKKTYLFLSFFIVSFILISIIGFNISSNIFMKNDNTDEIIYKSYKNNYLLQLNPINEIDLLSDSKDNIDLRKLFIENTDIDEYSKKEYDVIINDYSFNFHYTYRTYEEIRKFLDKNRYNKHYSIYYDPHNIVIGTKNEEILFENLQPKYHVVNNENSLRTVRILNKESERKLQALYIENFEDLLKPYLIGDSKFPTASNEVLISVETLINSNILKLKNKSNINEVYRQFKKLKEKDRVIEIAVPKVIIDENGEELIDTTKEEIVKFKIVGVYNAGEKIAIHYFNEENITMFFSSKAESSLNIQIDNLSEEYDSYLIPLYMEIDKELYETKNLEQKFNEIKEKILAEEYKKITEVLSEYYEVLELALENIDNKDSSSLIDSNKYPGLSYRELFDIYEEKYEELSNESNIYTEINLGLAYERTINEVFSSYYWNLLNNRNYYLSDSKYGKLELKNNLVEVNYYKVYITVEDMLKDLSDNLADIYNIKISENTFKHTVLIIGRVMVNPNLYISIINSIVSTILIIIILYIFEWVLAKLFRNIYQLFLVNRSGEFGSMRILGAKFIYIKRIMKEEGKVLLFMSYIFVLFILVIIKAITTFSNNSLVLYLHQPFSNIYLNINLIDFLNFNIFSVISIFILMQVLFKKQLIDDSIDKNLKDMSMLKSITQWDGE